MDVPIRDYIDRRFIDLWHALDEREKTFAVRVSEQQEALRVAREGLSRELLKMNEVREQLNEQAGQFARMDLVNSQMSTVYGKIDEQAKRLGTLELRVMYYLGIAAAGSALIGGVAAVIAQILMRTMF